MFNGLIFLVICDGLVQPSDALRIDEATASTTDLPD